MAGLGSAVLGWSVAAFSVSLLLDWVVRMRLVSVAPGASTYEAILELDVVAIAGTGEDVMSIAAAIMVTVRMVMSVFRAASLMLDG